MSAWETVFEERYVSDSVAVMSSLGEEDVLLISPTNSGKTKAIVDMIKKNYASKRILFLTSRIALATFVHSVCSDAGMSFVLYNRVGGTLETYDHLICSMESLHRVIGTRGGGFFAPDYDIVVVDEVTQFLEHLDSPTIEMRRFLWYQIMYWCRRAETKVLLADAYIMPNGSHMQALEAMIPCLHVLRNSYPLHKGHYTLYEDFKVHEEAMMRAFSERKRLVVCSTSKLWVNYVYSKFTALRPQANLVLLTGETKKSEIRRFIEDRNSLDGVDAVLYTSCIGAGVDVLAKGFDACYTLSNSHGPTPNGLKQMMDRFRKVTRFHVYCEPARDTAIYESMATYADMKRIIYTLADETLNIEANIRSLILEARADDAITRMCLTTAEPRGPMDEYVQTTPRSSAVFLEVLAHVLSYKHRCSIAYGAALIAILGETNCEVDANRECSGKNGSAAGPSWKDIMEEVKSMADTHSHLVISTSRSAYPALTETAYSDEDVLKLYKQGTLNKHKQRAFERMFMYVPPGEDETFDQRATAIHRIQSHISSRDVSGALSCNITHYARTTAQLLSLCGYTRPATHEIVLDGDVAWRNRYALCRMSEVDKASLLNYLGVSQLRTQCLHEGVKGGIKFVKSILKIAGLESCVYEKSRRVKCPKTQAPRIRCQVMARGTHSRIDLASGEARGAAYI